MQRLESCPLKRAAGIWRKPVAPETASSLITKHAGGTQKRRMRAIKIHSQHRNARTFLGGKFQMPRCPAFMHRTSAQAVRDCDSLQQTESRRTALSS